MKAAQYDLDAGELVVRYDAMIIPIEEIVTELRATGLDAVQTSSP